MEDLVEEICRALFPPKCPNCGRELDCLSYTGWVYASAHVFLSKITGKNGVEYSCEYLDWDYWEYEDNQYLCPHCEKVLATNEEDAIKILRGI